MEIVREWDHFGIAKFFDYHLILEKQWQNRQGPMIVWELEQDKLVCTWTRWGILCLEQRAKLSSAILLASGDFISDMVNLASNQLWKNVWSLVKCFIFWNFAPSLDDLSEVQLETCLLIFFQCLIGCRCSLCSLTIEVKAVKKKGAKIHQLCCFASEY